MRDIYFLIIALLVSDGANWLVVGLPYNEVGWLVFIVGIAVPVALIFLAYRGVYWATLSYLIVLALGCVYLMVALMKSDTLFRSSLYFLQFAMNAWGVVVCRRILQKISTEEKDRGKPSVS